LTLFHHSEFLIGIYAFIASNSKKAGCFTGIHLTDGKALEGDFKCLGLGKDVLISRRQFLRSPLPISKNNQRLLGHAGFTTVSVLYKSVGYRLLFLILVERSSKATSSALGLTKTF